MRLLSLLLGLTLIVSGTIIQSMEESFIIHCPVCPCIYSSTVRASLAAHSLKIHRKNNHPTMSEAIFSDHIKKVFPDYTQRPRKSPKKELSKKRSDLMSLVQVATEELIKLEAVDPMDTEDFNNSETDEEQL